MLTSSFHIMSFVVTASVLCDATTPIESQGNLRGDAGLHALSNAKATHRALSPHCTGWSDFPSGSCPLNRDGTEVGLVNCFYNYINIPIENNKGKCIRNAKMTCEPQMECTCDTRIYPEWECKTYAADYCDGRLPNGAYTACTP